MAVTTLCARLLQGHEAVCEAPASRYFQQAVVINKSDIDPTSVVVTGPTETECNYSVAFSLKEGATGYRFVGPESGSVFRGFYDKTRSDLGFPRYAHSVQMLLTGASEEAKCIMDSLDKGSYVVALELMDGTVEIYGFQNGLTTGDYTYDLQEGGGGAQIVLASTDVAPEARLPLVYKAEVEGSESADFDSAFANIVEPDPGV